MAGENWLQGIAARRRAQTLRAAIWVIAAMSIWLGMSAAGFWAWEVVFHHSPPGLLFLKWYLGLGSLIVAPFSAIAPLAPMKGKDPEVIAADEFFKGPER